MKNIFILSIVIGLSTIIITGCGKDDPVNPGNKEPLVTPVGTPIGFATTASIDVGGGTLTSDDGILQLTVPAGAVSAATNFTIQPVINYSPGGVGSAYRLLPEGISFNQNVTLTFNYADSVVANEDFVGIAFQGDDHTWFAPKATTLQASNNKINVQTKHFSDWCLFEKLSLSPHKASCQINESTLFKITFVGELQITDSEGVELNNLNNDPSVSTSWEATSGSIVKQGDDRGLYTAPSAVPSYNPVDVSVTFNNVSFTYHGKTHNNPTLEAKVDVYGEILYFDVVFTSSRTLEPTGDSWFTETDQGSMKVLVQGDSVTVYSIKNNKAEVLPGLIYDSESECTTTLLDAGDGLYHVSDSVTYGGAYSSITNQVYIGVSSLKYPVGRWPKFEKVCSGSSDIRGGELLPSGPATFIFDAGLQYQEKVDVIPGGGAFPDGFLKVAVTRTR